MAPRAWANGPFAARQAIKCFAPGTALELTTTWYEAFRWRVGRRSRNQLAALDWSGDPSPVLDHLVVFGPARADVIG